MDQYWSTTNWAEEDKLFMPKRRVNNRNSYSHPHIIGSFYSQRMKRVVEYESLGERLFFYYLELDRAVKRYYVQPVEVPMPKDNNLEDPWFHTPDVLVFREGHAPFLYQIKEEEEEFNNKQKLINERCEAYVIQHGWNYQVITPKSMPAVLSRNIRFLKNFLKERNYYSKWSNKVTYRLGCMERTNIHHLAESFHEEIDPLILKPLIYHLIAIGQIEVNVNEKIDTYSSIKLNKHMNSMISDSGKEILHVH